MQSADLPSWSCPACGMQWKQLDEGGYESGLMLTGVARLRSLQLYSPWSQSLHYCAACATERFPANTALRFAEAYGAQWPILLQGRCIPRIPPSAMVRWQWLWKLLRCDAEDQLTDWCMQWFSTEPDAADAYLTMLLADLESGRKENQ